MNMHEHGGNDESACAYENVFVRKGLIATFIAALRRYDVAEPGSLESAGAAAEIETLLPAIKALGVLDVFTLKSARARALLRSLDPDLPL
jgi:uncharacterized protein